MQNLIQFQNQNAVFQNLKTFLQDGRVNIMQQFWETVTLMLTEEFQASANSEY